jgi:hypothetical protein
VNIVVLPQVNFQGTDGSNIASWVYQSNYSTFLTSEILSSTGTHPRKNVWDNARELDSLSYYPVFFDNDMFDGNVR